MSTLVTTVLKNPDFAGNNITLNPDGSVLLNSIAAGSFATTAQMGGVTTTLNAVSAGSPPVLSVASGLGINNGDFVVCPGIPPGTTVVSGGGTTSITISGPALGNIAPFGGIPISFYRPDKPVSPGLVAGRLCSAWVNFDGTVSGTFAGSTSTVTRVAGSNLATVTTSLPHGLVTNTGIYALTGVVAGRYVVTVLTNTTFTITTAATTALTNASITFAVNSIRASYNVSSIADLGVGNYMVNFATPLPDNSYCAVASTNASSSSWLSVNRNGYQTESSVELYTTQASSPTDFSSINVVVFR